MLGQCAKCRRELLLRTPHGVVFAPDAVVPEPAFRLNTLQHKRVPMCRPCFAALSEADYATIATYCQDLHRVATDELSPLQIALEDPDLPHWQIIGRAEDIFGLEHGAERPTVYEHEGCGGSVADDGCCASCHADVPGHEVRARRGFVTRGDAA